MAVKKVKRSTRAPLQKGFQHVLKHKGQQNHEAAVAKPNAKALVIASTIHIAKLLANNDKKTRDHAIKTMRNFLTARMKKSHEFSEAEFVRLWKGLFYCMWLSDKPLVQEELAESISKLVHCFKLSKDVTSLYTAVALKTLGIEWIGLDQYRIDKFSMLARRIIRQTFEVCKKTKWDLDWVKEVSQVLEKLLLDATVCLGFKMHITELYLEELSKISCGKISEDAVTELVKPFAMYLISIDDERHIRHVMKHIFRYLIIQSDIGLDYMEKFEAWKRAGFPTGSIDAMEQIELSDEEKGKEEDEENDVREEENDVQGQAKPSKPTVLDPRAGRVDVELPQIPFNPKKLAELLSQYKFHPLSTTKSRRQILRLITEFTELSEGKMPLGVKEIRTPNVRKKDTDSKAAALRLLEFERSLYSDEERSKRKRKKSSKLNTAETVLNESEDDDTVEHEAIGKVQNKNLKKKRKIHDKTDVKNLTEPTSQESNAIGPDVKKKKCKTSKKLQSDHKTQVQSSNCELKKSTSMITVNDGKCKKTKAKRLGNIISPVKRKKPTNGKACGIWDVSDNIASQPPSQLINTDTMSHTVTNDKAVPKEPAEKNNIKNMFDQQTKWLIPVVKKLENEQQRTPTAGKQQIQFNAHSNSKKRVKIVLQRNTAQHTSEYIQKIRQSPAIPFDANRKPLVGVLKASPIPSPINPFYKKNIK